MKYADVAYYYYYYYYIHHVWIEFIFHINTYDGSLVKVIVISIVHIVNHSRSHRPKETSALDFAMSCECFAP